MPSPKLSGRREDTIKVINEDIAEQVRDSNVDLKKPLVLSLFTLSLLFLYLRFTSTFRVAFASPRAGTCSTALTSMALAFPPCTAVSRVEILWSWPLKTPTTEYVWDFP